MARGKKDDTPPGEAEPPEGTPAARDGEPDADELARRRKERNGTSLSERIANGEGAEDETDEPELFPAGVLDGDPKRTLKTLIRAGANVAVTASLTKAEVPMRGIGLFDPESTTQVLVTVEPGEVTSVPEKESDGAGGKKITGWKLRQQLRAVHVQHAGEMFTHAQVLDLLHEADVSSAVVSRLLGQEGGSIAQ
jgi:hypothetical protein